jgi:hypothetical protein
VTKDLNSTHSIRCFVDTTEKEKLKDVEFIQSTICHHLYKAVHRCMKLYALPTPKLKPQDH